MDDLIELRATTIGAGFEPTRSIFDLSTADQSIFELLSLSTPVFRDVFHSIQRRIPLPQTAAPRTDGSFYRLPNHNRSFCYSLASSEAIFDAPAFIFKGTEPLLPDFSTLLDWMQQAPLRRSTRVMTDHFPLAEGKIPGSLSLKEAVHEAEIALDIQRRHLKHYGELARIPTPLLVHSFEKNQVSCCRATLHNKLSPTAFEKIEPLLETGLAIYIYYYPSAPIRANYWGGAQSPQLKEYVQRTFNEQAAVCGWIELIVRLFYLGYLPYSVRNEGLGACMDFGNATLDGGFCDPDSIIPIETSPDDEFVRESVIETLDSVQKTLQLLLGLSVRPDLYPNINEFVCRQYILRSFEKAIRSESRPGLSLDERVLQLLSPESVADVRLNTRRNKRITSYAHYQGFLEAKTSGLRD